MRRGIRWRGAVVPVAILALVEIAAATTDLAGGGVAPPSKIGLAAFDALLDGSLLAASAQTLFAAISGVLIGSAIGLVLGVMLGLSRFAYWVAEVTLECFRPIPSVALIPVVLLIFGLGYWMEISLVAKSALWPVFFFSVASVRGIRARLIEVSRLLEMNPFERMWKIVIPAALPGIFVGFRLSLGIALIVAVTVEVAANPLGLGNAMMRAQETVRPYLMLAYLLWIGLVGWALNSGILWLQERLFGRGARPAAQA